MTREDSNVAGFRRRFGAIAIASIATLQFSLACSTPAPTPAIRPRQEPEPRTVEKIVYRKARADQSAQLMAEIERLRKDLGRAEEALVLAESGLRGNYSRADAVSSLAEARIQLERAARGAPWRRSDIVEARKKLVEADRQIEQSNFGAALFFIDRSRRITDQAQFEAELVGKRPETLFVQSDRANLRAGPSTRDVVIRSLPLGSPVFPERKKRSWVLVRATSGSVGWIHQNILSRDRARFESGGRAVPGAPKPN